MACTQQMHLFDDGEAMFFGDGDLFGNTVPCIAGELELQVQSYEGVGDVPVGDSSAGKSFSLTKDSGGSSLSALAAGFGDPDFMDNVSLDDLAAADHYGHTICGRQSTADSTAVACSGRNLEACNTWTGAGILSAGPKTHQPGLGLGGPDGLQGGQESSDCDMSHTHGDGESSGVGKSSGVALGSSHSEASEDNTAGVAPSATACDEEHISTPSFGLSLSRLTHAGSQSLPAEAVSKTRHQTDFETQVDQQQPRTHMMPRAFSVDNFALTGVGAGGAGPSSAIGPDSAAPQQPEGLRRAQVYRSYSYVAPDTLSMDFVLGCGDSGSQYAFGARGRCASLNETQLRRQWLQEGELLAPQLPPSVSELELLELPEDSIPIRPSSIGACFLGQQEQQLQLTQPGAGTRPLGSGLMQFKGSSNAAGSSSGSGGAGAGPGASALAPGVTVTVKRKIITSPSPLLQQSKPVKARQAAAAAATTSATGKGSSPKRVKLSGAAWQDAAGAAAAPSSAGVLAGWQPPPTRQPGSGGSMKTVRSMPANMNSFMDGVEVTVQPLGPPGAASSTLNAPAASAAPPHQAFARGGGGPFFDPSGGNAVADANVAVSVAAAGLQGATGKGAKSKAAAAQSAGVMPGAGMGGVPGAFVMPGGVLIAPDGKRLGPVPSVPKPRKRASPNGNPPKAPAPNPNGHCCTQCGTQTTPVWRAGPHGPKTLCNACGVRYMKVAKGNVAPTPRRQQH